MSKLKIYSSKKIELTEKEKIEYEKKVQKEVEKYKRDSLCGGVDGSHFVRLHDRNT